MTKEIIINAGELESRVAVLENGRLMELHVEREPKIVGNIYKGRVTKVLKGMDAAFVDIGIERNAFLAASDVIPADGDDDGSNGHGRSHRSNLPPINELLKANQEVLLQVVRAPMGTKGARVTTRLSLPGRYMVLMLNSGTYVGVSRKIEDPKERARLRAIANEIRPEQYSLIVRTEAEGKSEEELRQDIVFLLDMASRIEKKAVSAPAPSLIHGDLTLIFRLIRDSFTRDVNRLVVDSPTTYENVLELVGMIAPRMKNRVYLYDEPMPVFHTYNVEPEIERTLRRKVWLPSGGTLIIDQAEALTAIDVNTGRFVGSVELAETVLTTNLQAAEEVARQLRLRDLGGIIVVDFIDMDNPKHRQQVIKAFDEALKRDRAKIKIHNISPLGLVEMTRKRTGDSLSRLLTEPCPYCSGIGRVQNSLTMALRIERELAATNVTHPNTEAYLLTAHPRVVASMLGYEGEAQRDLEEYLGRAVYLRSENDFHPNTYNLERLTLEQALIAVPHLEEDEIVEAQVVNPDPEVSLAPLAIAKGQYLVIPDLDAPVGSRVKVRVRTAGTSLAIAEPLAAEQRGIRTEEPALPIQRPTLVAEFVLPAYLREERAAMPPRGLPLLSPTAESVPMPAEEEIPLVAVSPTAAVVESVAGRRRKRPRRRRAGEQPVEAQSERELIAIPEGITEEVETAPVTVEEGEVTPVTEEAPASTSSSRRRRRRRRGRGGANNVPAEAVGTPEHEEAGEPVEITEAVGAEGVLEVPPLDEVVAEEPATLVLEASTAEPVAETPAKSRRRRGGRRRRAAATPEPDALTLSVLPITEPILEAITPEAATEAMLGMLNAIPGEDETITTPAAAVEVEETPVEAMKDAGTTVEEVPVAGEEAAAPTIEEITVPVTEVAAPKPRRAPRRRTKKAVVEEPLAIAEPEVIAPEANPAPPVEETIMAPVETPAEEHVEAPAPAVEEAPTAEEPQAPVVEKPKRRRKTPAATSETAPATPRRRTRKTAKAEETPTEDSVTPEGPAAE